ncbi:Uncharacterised protein [Mycobacteroides abscessus subsp. abscessus]|nr:Uncharacterised protein [Mycobacteroides abscessus subsp. abscessus]
MRFEAVPRSRSRSTRTSLPRSLRPDAVPTRRRTASPNMG